MTEMRKCSHTLFWVFIVLLVFVLAGSLMLNLGLFISVAGSQNKFSSGKPVDERPDMKEIWSYGQGTDKAARIAVKGPIIRTIEKGIFSKKDRVKEVIMQIRAAGNDPLMKAIILEVDSPGGAITPCDEIYKELLDFKKGQNNRKIIVLMKSMAASGGYYISLAGDHIMAEPTTLTGSIGVIIQTLNWKTLSEKIGITDTTIKSGKNKDLLNPFRDISEEQKQILQNSVDALHARFVHLVHTHRNIDMAELQTLADGRIFTADEALKHRLIDQIGYWTDVMEKARELCQTDSLKIIKYEKKSGFMEQLFEARQSIDLETLLAPRSPQILYMWK